MSVRIILLRHGETYDNLRKTMGGDENTLLTPNGHVQAKHAAVALAQTHIDAIYVSDLPRTKETAEPIIAQHHNATVTYDARIREIRQGVLAGAPKGSKRRLADAAGIPFIAYTPEGGESVLDLRKRVYPFLHEIIKKHQGETVLVVSHGGVITRILLYLQQLEDTPETFDAHHPKNTAITILDIDEDGTHRIHVLNSTDHLE